MGIGWVTPGGGGGPVSSDDVSNASLVPGATVTDALNSLAAAIPTVKFPYTLSANANNASGGTPFAMAGGVTCDPTLFRGVPVPFASVLTTLAWARDDLDAGSLRVQVYRAGATVFSAVVPVPAAARSGVAAVGPFSVVAGDQVAITVDPLTANSLTRPRAAPGFEI